MKVKTAINLIEALRAGVLSGHVTLSATDAWMNSQDKSGSSFCCEYEGAWLSVAIYLREYGNNSATCTGIDKLGRVFKLDNYSANEISKRLGSVL